MLLGLGNGFPLPDIKKAVLIGGGVGVPPMYNLAKQLKAKGVEEIPAMGETFDPALHEAVSSVQDPEKNAQEIVQEYRKGYKIGSKVIRHSMVVVAN